MKYDGTDINETAALEQLAAETQARKQADTSRKHDTSYRQRHELAEIRLHTAVTEIDRLNARLWDKTIDCAIWRFGFVAAIIVVIITEALK